MIPTIATSLFAHVMFIPEGTAYTVPGAGTTGRSAKPGAADPLWESGNFGDCEEFKLAPESEEYEVRGGTPGGLVVKDIVELGRMLKLSFTAQQLSPTVLRGVFATLNLSGSSTQANPLEGSVNKKGWLKFQAYDTDNALQVVGELWGRLKVSNVEPWSGANIVKASFDFTTIFSQYNSLAFPTAF